MRPRRGAIGKYGDTRGFSLGAFVAVAAWLLAAPPALAGPPLITDDPDTPGRNRWEVNLSYGLTLTAERVEVEPSRFAQLGTTIFGNIIEKFGLSDLLMIPEPKPGTIHRRNIEYELPLIDINYGITDRDQLKIEFPVLISDPADGSTPDGMGNLLVGYKYRILDEADFAFSLSLYPQFALPTGARRLGLDRKPAYILPVEVGRHFLDDKLFVYGEVGFVAAPGKDFDDEWFYGVAAEWELIERFTVIGEVNGSVPTSGPGDSDVVFNLGFKWETSERLSVLAAMGRSFRSAGPDSPEYLGCGGLQFTF